MIDPLRAFRSAVLRDLGAAPDDIEPGRLQRFSLNGRRADTAGWCHLFADGLAGVYGDWRSGASATWTARPGASLSPAERAAQTLQVAQARAQRDAQQRRQWADNATRNRTLWAECRPLSESLDGAVTRYLRFRLKLDNPPIPLCLREHPNLSYWHDGHPIGTWPAMVAALQAPDGRLLALHRTWLTADGRKAPVPGPVKKLTGAAGPLAGACIRLALPTGGSGHEPAAMGVAEGIETALAAMCASGLPTVAAYSAGNLAAWRWPAGVRRLTVFADNDRAGAAAAQTLRQRARAAGLTVDVLTPSAAGADWADVWANRDNEVQA